MITEKLINKYDHDKVYVILGTGHSGTSFLSRCLYEAGVDMGCKGNDKSEDAIFIDLNNRILEKAGGSWNHPPTREEILTIIPEFEDEIKTIVKNRRGKFWGWKDPRTTYTISGLLPYLDGDVYLLIAARRPEKVAKSLTDAEPNVDIDHARKLVKTQSKLLIDELERFLELK